jgi:hypothetical protein
VMQAEKNEKRKAAAHEGELYAALRDPFSDKKCIKSDSSTGMHV